jgi:hypothetical protein
MDATAQAALALSVNTIFGACVTGTLLLCDAWSIWEHRHKITFATPHTRWRVSLMFAALFAFCVFLLDGVLVWRTWTGNESGCSAITIPHVLFYFFQKQCVYLFLYDRAKIVHESLSIEGTKLKYLKWFRMLLWLVIVVGELIWLYVFGDICI